MFGWGENGGGVKGMMDGCVDEDLEEWGEGEGGWGREVVGMERGMVFEWGLDGMVEYVVMVYGGLELGIRGGMEGDGGREGEIRGGIWGEMDEEEKKGGGEYVILNEEKVEVDREIGGLEEWVMDRKRGG